MNSSAVSNEKTDNQGCSYRNLKQLEDTNNLDLKSRYFIICNSCFWCASWIRLDKVPSVKCPCCHDGNGSIGAECKALEYMPLSDGEHYRFEHVRDLGTVLEFL
jgi:hypothetical protein